MDVRAQVSMVFNLDKCIGCHTCSIACKNIWTDRGGAEYMWWNNVETKPGTGYPTLWEDQNEYKGGWQVNAKNGKIKLRLQSKLGTLKNIFYNKALPNIEDYYEPWTYDYQNLYNAPASDTQPAAQPISLLTGKPMEIKMGPAWDDDFGGSQIYAANDPNLEGLSEDVKAQLFEIERLVFFYLPRICNHCLNAGCIAACPSGAIYKRGEDGIVLVNQDKCRGWRMCVSGCPYKKVYYNWRTGKSEKCILCYPRLETGQPPACFHSCVGRIRYLGLLLYDADQIKSVASTIKDEDLVEAQRKLILDPFDPEVIEAAKISGMRDEIVEFAQKSPVYRYVKEWEIALPLHPEYRTVPMLFYVPPLGPLIGNQDSGSFELNDAGVSSPLPELSNLENLRIPIKYMASLFSGGNEEIVKDAYKKLMATRIYMHSIRTKAAPEELVNEALNTASISGTMANDIWYLYSMASYRDRFVIPPMYREEAIQLIAGDDPFNDKSGAGHAFKDKSESGFGSINEPKRHY